jgi:multicomponent Na+:H+ antiporter subunit B
MTLKTRPRLFLVAGLGFFALFIFGVRGLTPVGQQISPYAEKLNSLAVRTTQVTEAVSAVNFGFRAFDTMGEEYILFTSVLGILLLLRRQSDETQQSPRKQAPGRKVPLSSDAVRVLVLGLTAPSLLFGIDVVTHGQVTPGGGFQGGIILATVLLFVFLAGDFEIFSKVNAHQLAELAEAAGGAGFVLVGLAPAFVNKPFLANFLPLARPGTVLSGGNIPLINIAVATEVSAGIILLATAFLEETLVLRTTKGK